MAPSHNSGISIRPPPQAGSPGEKHILDLEGMDFSQYFLQSTIDDRQFPQQPTEDIQGPNEVASGPESLSHVPGSGFSGLRTRHGALSTPVSLPFEIENTQRTPSLVAPTAGRDLFLRETDVLRTAFRKKPNPSDLEILQTSFETGLEEYQVSIWFQCERDFRRSPAANGLITPETTRSLVLPSNPYSNPTLDLMPEQHAEDSSIQALETNPTYQQRNLSIRDPRLRKRQRQAGRSQNTTSTLAPGYPQKRPRRRMDRDSDQEKYACPSCSSKSKSMDQWHTHQKRRHFPTEIFICGMNVGQKPCKVPPSHPFKRKDNSRFHLTNSHGYELVRALDEEVSKWAIEVTGLFHDKCGFCQETFTSRGESMKHIGAHIEEGAEIEKWVHRCSAPTHEIVPNVHFIPPCDISNINNDDWDEDDTDQEEFGGARGGDSEFGNGDGSFGSNSGQGPGIESSSDGAGGTLPFLSPRGASNRVAGHRAHYLKLDSSSDEYEALSNLPGLFQQYSTVRTLGAGGFGTLFEVSLGESKQNFDLKTLWRKQTSSCQALDYHAFNNEVRIMKARRHRHAIQFVGSYIQPQRFSLLLSPVADMNLSKYMRTIEETSLTVPAVRECARVLQRGMSSLAEALSHLHSFSISHHDIKPANILVKDDNFLMTDLAYS